MTTAYDFKATAIDGGERALAARGGLVVRNSVRNRRKGRP